MVYCDKDMCESKLGKLMQAFRADRPSEWQMDEFIWMAEMMHKDIHELRKSEKDAARYRWLMQNAKLGLGRNGKDWDLQIDGPAPDSISEVGEWIDNVVDGRM